MEIRGEQVNSDERRALIGGQRCARELNSCERMLAGVGCIADGQNPAKPVWSEVIIFLGLFLRRGSPCPEESVSSDEQGAHRKTVSGRSFADTLLDKGTGGEFMIYSHLEKLGEPNRLLPHLHLPKSDGTMIEIDLVMIARTGIYVFESKNFSGCIFGDEDSRYWTQTMKRGPKYEFYNPIWQNDSRISTLKRQLALEADAFKSYVVFSDRCTLKKMYVESRHVKVMNRSMIVREIIKDMAELPDIFTPLEINQIYSELVPYTRTAAAIGQARIETVRLE